MIVSYRCETGGRDGGRGEVGEGAGEGGGEGGEKKARGISISTSYCV